MKTIYLIRHSMTGRMIDNYKDFKNNVTWEEYNRNMLLTVEGEEKAKKLCDVEELQNIEDIYASNSARAIATAKYLADKQNLLIKLDDRINEIEFDVKYYSEMPDDFNYQMFKNKDLKINTHESFNDMDRRLDNFIKEILDSDRNNVAIVIHGIILLSYLGSIAEETFDGSRFKVTFNGNVILDGTPKAPDIYKLEFDDSNNIINITNILIET